jgi:hypothetical protein
VQIATAVIGGVLMLAVSVNTTAAPSRHQTRQSAPQNDAKRETNAQLVEAVRSTFKKKNAIVQKVTILETRSAAPRGPHVLIAEGVRQDEEFHGNFEDELFGVFLLSSDLTHIEKVIELMPTPRWRDYELRIESLTTPRLVVTGQGSTYGDQPMRRIYDLGSK